MDATDAVELVNHAPDWNALDRCIQTTAPHWTPPPGLVKLREWPDLSAVPEEYIAPVSRICALLWNKPTASHLISRILGGDREETYKALQMLQAFGFIEMFSIHGSEPQHAPAPSAEPVVPETPVKSGLSSFIGKLRQRLLG